MARGVDRKVTAREPAEAAALAHSDASFYLDVRAMANFKAPHAEGRETEIHFVRWWFRCGHGQAVFNDLDLRKTGWHDRDQSPRHGSGEAAMNPLPDNANALIAAMKVHKPRTDGAGR